MKWRDTNLADGKIFLQFELSNFTSSLLVLGGDPGKASEVPGLRYPMGGKCQPPTVATGKFWKYIDSVKIKLKTMKLDL